MRPSGIEPTTFRLVAQCLMSAEDRAVPLACHQSDFFRDRICSKCFRDIVMNKSFAYKESYRVILDFKLSPCSVCCMFSSG